MAKSSEDFVEVESADVTNGAVPIRLQRNTSSVPKLAHREFQKIDLPSGFSFG
jgi:hypothetical protein